MTSVSSEIPWVQGTSFLGNQLCKTHVTKSTHVCVCWGFSFRDCSVSLGLLYHKAILLKSVFIFLLCSICIKADFLKVFFLPSDYVQADLLMKTMRKFLLKYLYDVFLYYPSSWKGHDWIDMFTEVGDLNLNQFVINLGN